MNELKRDGKWQDLHSSSSEDAVTWTVCKFLLQNNLLNRLASNFDLTSGEVKSVLLWGVPFGLNKSSEDEIRERILALSAHLGERERTEPDIIFDFGRHGIVLIEVKYRSPNAEQDDNQLNKFDRYLDDNAFADDSKIKESKLYELARNWRFAWELADKGKRPFRLINLGLPILFKSRSKPDRKRAALDSFSTGVSDVVNGKFIEKKWFDFLNTFAAEIAKTENEWFKSYISEQDKDLMKAK